MEVEGNLIFIVVETHCYCGWRSAAFYLMGWFARFLFVCLLVTDDWRTGVILGGKLVVSNVIAIISDGLLTYTNSGYSRGFDGVGLEDRDRKSVV